jgi:carotenoid cleavage dioxygenase-like enzyme
MRGIFGNPFQVSKREITKHISRTQFLTKYDKNLLKNINGFYGMIGPDIDESKIKSVYELFAGDGIIQGIFFDNGNITFVKKFIRTEKLVFEEKYGKIPNNLFMTALFTIGSSLKLLPNIIGRANTALININKNVYALFEGDNPYLLNIDFENKAINTIKKVNIPNIDYFCAHSKFNNDEQQIESLDYDVMGKSVNYYLLNSAFQIINQTRISTSSIPFVHDFIATDNSILITESPLVLKMNSLKNLKVPIELANNSTTKIHIIDKIKNNYESYEVRESIFIFHYAEIKENDEYI